MRRPRLAATRPAPRPRAPRVLGLEAGTTPVLVGVRESSRIRRPRVAVHGDGAVEVVVPPGTPERVIDRLLAEHGAWAADRSRRALERRQRVPALALERPGHVPLAGAWVAVVRKQGGRGSADLRDGRLHVNGPDAAAAEAIERWYRRTARALLGTAVTREASLLGVEPGRLSIRDQRTRWASCSRSGALSFSWRLVLAPEAVLDYVVVHELCHLVEPGHAAPFWRLVETARPGWRASHRWLRDHGHELHAFDPRHAARGGRALTAGG